MLVLNKSAVETFPLQTAMGSDESSACVGVYTVIEMNCWPEKDLAVGRRVTVRAALNTTPSLGDKMKGAVGLHSTTDVCGVDSPPGVVSV